MMDDILSEDNKEISITTSIRVTLQEFEDYIYYVRNVGGHEILP